VRTEFWDGSQVGGIGPRALWASAADVAHAAIEGMIAGRRTVMPRLFDQLAATGGRHVPRSLMLPVWHRIASRGFGER
jgi:short-subunit dehydrogenase